MTSLRNWTRTDIVFALRRRGTTAAALAKAEGLSRNTLYSGMERRYPKVQRIIAAALKLEPRDIWPEWYPPEGNGRGELMTRRRSAA